MQCQATMDTPDSENAYIPMHSVHSFSLERNSENIYENPNRIRIVSWSSRIQQVWKQVCGLVLCLGLPCLVLLVVVLMLVKNNTQRDHLQENYINLTRERETLHKRLYQLDRLKHDLTEEKAKLERRLSDLDNIHRNVTAEKGRLHTNISELDWRNRKLAEERKDLERRLSQMMERERNLTEINERNRKKLADLRWHYFNLSWYYLSSEKRNWRSSRQYCKDKGIDLVVINSQEEQLFLAGMALQAWIGLTDLNEEGVWKWVDNTSLTKAYWTKGQPNNYKGQDCALIWDRANLLEAWNDENCSRKLQWVCEM